MNKVVPSIPPLRPPPLFDEQEISAKRKKNGNLKNLRREMEGPPTTFISVSDKLHRLPQDIGRFVCTFFFSSTIEETLTDVIHFTATL